MSSLAKSYSVDSLSPSVSDNPMIAANESEPQKVISRTNGRPRSEKSMQAILDTTNKMLLHTSVRDISIEAIAKRAGVGKTTIYRWWPNKVALILDAVAGPLNVLPAPVSGENARDLLSKQLDRFIRICRGRGGKIITEIYAEVQGNPEYLALFFEKFMLQHEEILANILQQGKASGEFRPTLDIPVAVDMIYGSIFYHLMSHQNMLDHEFSSAYIIETFNHLR